MARVGVMNVRALPGAATAIAAVREHGLAVVVVTAKIRHLAESTLEYAGLTADEIYGNVWATEKAVPLREVKASAYVGDHPGDMVAAREAGVMGVGVTSGSSTVDELRVAGADVVLDSLGQFPDWLSRTLAAVT
jgi:phosphoglycolate phosphatase-like HAD superfamily hydrolase